MNSFDADVMANQEKIVAEYLPEMRADLSIKLEEFSQSDKLFQRTLSKKEWRTWLVANKQESKDVLSRFCGTKQINNM